MPYACPRRPAPDACGIGRHAQHQTAVRSAAHRRTPDPFQPRRPTRPHPRISHSRVHRGRDGRTSDQRPASRQKGRLMPNARGRRRRFGSVRQLRSGQWQARYQDPEGILRPAERTFPTKTQAEQWLTRTEADLLAGDWTDPDAALITFREYATDWIDERPGLRPKTIEVYRYVLGRHLLPSLGTKALSEIKEAQVRRWRRSLLDGGTSPVT